MANPTNLARDMARSLDAAGYRNGHIGKVRRYLKGDHDIPYAPQSGGASEEFLPLARVSITNWLPKVGNQFVKSAFVDGYRTGKSETNVPLWLHWQANKLDSRQVITTSGAVHYGTSYVQVRPGLEKTRPVWKPLKAQHSLAWYADDDDDYPEAGLVRTGATLDGDVVYELLYGEKLYTFVRESASDRTQPNDPMNPRDGKDLLSGGLTLVSEEFHGMPYVPWARFRDQLGDEATGIIRPLIPLQDQINNTRFALNIALQYASFKQMWATGLVIPKDTQETLPDGSANPNFGRPIEPFKSAVNRLWVSESPETKFGQFDQAEVEGHLASYESAVRSLASTAETSPLVLTGDLANVSAEALSVLNHDMNEKAAELRTLFGESWEQVFAMSAQASGEKFDPAAEVKWRDTEPKSFAQVVDGLLKLHQMGAPAKGLLDLVPGLSDQTIESWRDQMDVPTEADKLLAAIQTPAPEAE